MPIDNLNKSNHQMINKEITAISNLENIPALDYRRVLGQICHHLGVEIELRSIDIHNSSIEQGKALNYIGQILKTFRGEINHEEKLDEICSLLDIDKTKFNLLELV